MKIAQYNDMMSYLTRPAEVERAGFKKGGLTTEVQEYLKQQFPDIDFNFDKYKFGIPKSGNENVYAVVQQKAYRKIKKPSIGIDIEELDYPEGYGTPKQFIEKLKSKNTDIKIPEELKVNQFARVFDINRIDNPYNESLTLYDLTKLDDSDFLDSIEKAQVRTGKSTPEAKEKYASQDMIDKRIKRMQAFRRKKERQLQGGKINLPKETGKEFHHILPLAGKELITDKGVAAINQEMNNALMPYNRQLNKNANRIEQLAKKPDSPERRKEIEKINFSNKNIISKAGKELPSKYRGLLGYYEYDTVNLDQPRKKKAVNPKKSIGGLEGEEIKFKEIGSKGRKEFKEKTVKDLTVSTDNILQNIAAGKESQAGFMRADVPLELVKGAGKLGLKALGPLGTVAGTVGVEGALAAGRPIEETLKDPLTGLALVLPEAGKNVVRNARLANLLNLGMKASTLARLTPIGLGITGLQLGYGLYEKGQEQKAKIDAMTPYQRELYESQMEGQAFEGEAAGFKKGGSVKKKKPVIDPKDKGPFDEIFKKMFSEYEWEKKKKSYRDEFATGGRPKDKKSKKDLPGQKDPNLPIDPSRRDFLEGAGGLGLAAVLAAKGALKFGPEIKQAVTGVTSQIDQVPNIVNELYFTIKNFGKQIDYPKSGSDTVKYEFGPYKMEEGPGGYNITKTTDSDYRYQEEYFEVYKNPETGVIEYEELTVRPDMDGKLKDVDYGVELDSYREIGEDLAKIRGDDSLIKIADDDIIKQIEKEEAYKRSLQKKGTGEND